MKKIPVGISDFREIIQENYYYIDKSMIIKDVIDIGSKAFLIPRPRRFGKTLNISMLRYYFEKGNEDNSYLFKDLAIGKAGADYTSRQGQYPVIFLTFKDIKSDKWVNCYDTLKRIIAEEYKRHRYLLESHLLYKEDKETFTNIIELKGVQADYEFSLRRLSEYLSKYHNQNVMVLIDEYDTPIQSGYMEGYYKDIIGFMKNLLSGVLKDNVFLEKGILTGILRVAKESIFTGLNHFEVYSILRDEFSTYFGLLEEEVVQMIETYHIEYELNDVKRWYNGYVFGENTVYNPWSIISFVKQHKYGLMPHWINTSSNSLVKSLIIDGGQRFKRDIEKLIKGESVEKAIDENVVFEDLSTNPDAVWSFLLFTGYLKFIDRKIKNDEWLCQLQIPNQEVNYFYRKTIMEWFKGSTTSEKMQDMLEGLISGDMETFAYYFKQFVINTMSYFDPTGEEPERVYQAFVLGILVNLSDNYYVKSNRGSGLGRYDIALIPRDIKRNNKGIIFELKRANPIKKETIEEALIAAEKQIADKQYDVELLDSGVNKEDIIKIAIAFSGKDTLVKWK